MSTKWFKESGFEIFIQVRSYLIPSGWREGEPATGLPIDFYFQDKLSPEGYCTFHYFANDEIPFPGRRKGVDYLLLKIRYDLIQEIAPGEEMKLYNKPYKPEEFTKKPGKSKVSEILNSRNEHGVWISDVSVFDTIKTMIPELDHGKIIRGISTKNYVSNMRTL